MYAGYRFPAKVIGYAVDLHFRFPLSLRMVEEMLALRGITVSHESVRQWGLKFGREIANRINVAGEKHYLWRAVDQDGFVLDVLFQSPRDKKAAKKDLKLRCEHRQHKGLNNRAKNSHQPIRRRERQMKRFKSPRCPRPGLRGLGGGRRRPLGRVNNRFLASARSVQRQLKEPPSV
ncbi:IS6 family transposase [Azospirillum formosense]|nr:DDE-type integrase/transposase/recombinase [Azospirillum formosense]MBY3757307.1 IS6 family transposase [Azospirillum formosense]